jgi:hypothetical protein
MNSWDLLDRELTAWEGEHPTLWWRDDDAQRQTSELDRLNALSLKFSLPLQLAVIPQGACASLLDAFDANPDLWALQHGFSHRNHAPASERKCELGDHRPLVEVLAELSQGRERLRELLPDHFLPVLVPPWNRMAEAVAKSLPQQGFVGLSTLGPRTESSGESCGLRQVNVHVDLINWRKGRCFAGEEAVLAQLIEHLRARREGQVDATEPTGIMTHHLAHDEGCWNFCEQLFAFLHQRCFWLSAPQLFTP